MKHQGPSSTRYAVAWSRCWSLVCAVGIGLAFLAWTPVNVVTVFLTAALCAAIMLALATPADGPSTPALRVRWAVLGTRSLVVASAVVAFGAYIAVLPYLALPLLALAVGSSPWVVERLVRGRRAGEPTSRAGAAPAVVADSLESGPNIDTVVPWPGPAGCRLDVSADDAQRLSETELCREWRRSFLTLQSAHSPGKLMRVVSQRQIYLDELERRCPSALQAWLASGARAAGGPERFLPGQRRDGRSDVA
jgi:hypothetical protein